MKKWRLASSKTIVATKWLTLKENAYELPNGELRTEYYHIDKHDCVVIVAELPDEQLVVIRQYRRAVDEILYEFPAGLIDTDESVLEIAVRELEEETGYTGTPILLGGFVPQPAFLSMKSYFVLVKVTGQKEIQLKGDENIEAFAMTLDQINQMILNGEISDMSLVAALYAYLLHQKSATAL